MLLDQISSSSTYRTHKIFSSRARTEPGSISLHVWYYGSKRVSTVSTHQNLYKIKVKCFQKIELIKKQDLIERLDNPKAGNYYQ